MSSDSGREPGVATPSLWGGRRVFDLTDRDKMPYLCRAISQTAQPFTVLWVGDISNSNLTFAGLFGGHPTSDDYLDYYITFNNSHTLFTGSGASGFGTVAKQVNVPSVITVSLAGNAATGASIISVLGKGSGSFRRTTGTGGVNDIYQTIVAGNSSKRTNFPQLGYLKSFAFWLRALSVTEIDQIEAFYTGQCPGLFA